MKIFGLTITRQKAVPPTLSSVYSRGGWFSLVREPFTGAWQRNVEWTNESVLTFSTVFACVTLIASDISKLRIKLVAENRDDIWEEVESAAFSPVLRKPNRYQTHIDFIEQWVLSKLLHGNTYVLKARDQRGVVVAMYVLDPLRAKPLVAADGSVYYQIGQDNLSQVTEDSLIVPASEIIHDKFNTFYHPLVGISPISACGLAALQGIRVQEHSANFFGQGARPGGILTAPGVISEETAKRLAENWETNFGGDNVGKVAVLGDGLKYEAMTMNAVDSELIAQLRISSEQVCSVFHVPPYKVGVGPAPSFNNIESLNQEYYQQTLQNPIERIERLLNEGLGLVDARTTDGRRYGTEFDLAGLLRMDTSSRVKSASDAINSGGMAPNEARKRYLDLGPVPGGDKAYLQRQMWPLEQLGSDIPTPTPPQAASNQATPARAARSFLKAMAAWA